VVQRIPIVHKLEEIRRCFAALLIRDTRKAFGALFFPEGAKLVKVPGKGEGGKGGKGGGEGAEKEA
jgi:hypothetical protein